MRALRGRPSKTTHPTKLALRAEEAPTTLGRLPLNADGEAGGQREKETHVVETRSPRGPTRAEPQLLANYWRAGDEDSRHAHSTEARQPAQPPTEETSAASRRASTKVEARQAARNGKLRAPGIERSPSTSSASCKCRARKRPRGRDSQYDVVDAAETKWESVEDEPPRSRRVPNLGQHATPLPPASKLRRSLYPPTDPPTFLTDHREGDPNLATILMPSNHPESRHGGEAPSCGGSSPRARALGPTGGRAVVNCCRGRKPDAHRSERSERGSPPGGSDL